MKSFVAVLLLVAYAGAAVLPEYVELSFHIGDGEAWLDEDGATCDDPVDGSPNLCDAYVLVKIDGKQVYKTKEEDNTAHPVFNEIFKTGKIRSDAIIVFEMWDSDSGSSADDPMSKWSGTADYYLKRHKLVSKTVKNKRRNTLNVSTELLNQKKPPVNTGNLRISIEIVSAVVTFDAYIIIKIGGEKVFKSKTIDSNSHSTIGETFVSDAIEVDAIIEIEMWNSNTVDLVSTWKGNAEYFTTRGEQTLSSEKTSLTIRAKYTKGSENGNGTCGGGESSCDNCKQNKYATANMVSGSCSTKAGCYNGQCWAYCDWGTKYTKGNWCYTTKSETKSGKYIKCTDDSECNPCWNCAGECGL